MRPVVRLAILAILVSCLMAVGCAQSGPAPVPTKAPAAPTAAEPARAATAAPTKAAEPTKPAAQPAATSVPAKKVDFPAQGKAINLIVPYAAGGGSDVAARILTAMLEKELNSPVQVVNRVGAASQVGMAETATAKPDGYSLGYPNFPTISTLYMNPERKATFDRRSFEPVAVHVADTTVIVVPVSSPYKDLKELVDAAKAKPNQIKFSDNGIMTPESLRLIQLQKLAEMQVTVVHMDGVAPQVTALAGGHVDAGISNLGGFFSAIKGGQLRALAILSKEPSTLAPDIKTAESQGFKLYSSIVRGILAPAGTPKDVVNVLAAAIKKVMDTADHKSKIEAVLQQPQYMGPEEFGAYWDSLDAEMKPLMEAALKEQK